MAHTQTHTREERIRLRKKKSTNVPPRKGSVLIEEPAGFLVQQKKQLQFNG